MKTIKQLLEATVLYDKGSASGPSKKISKELKKIHTPKSKTWGTYNPAAKLFKTSQKLGFRRVQVSQGSTNGENHPNHHMEHPSFPGHHIIINRKGYVHRTPEGKVTAGPQAGSLLNSLGKHKDFSADVKIFKKQRDDKRGAKKAALAHAHAMPTE